MAETSFYARALHEGERYGGDPYVFVRELAQNARDAGATQLIVSATVERGLECLVFEDDGSGMTFEHARAFLFRLYASSKETSRDAAGHFGVGFWSILRHRASELRIDSRTGAEQWAVVFDGKLAHPLRVAPELDHHGTRITLTRPVLSLAQSGSADDSSFAADVHRALYRYCRYLRRRAVGLVPLPIILNGQRVDEPLELDSPMRVAFRGRASEGVIGFGAVPHVELWARGLWVQSVSALEELEPDRGARQARPAPEGLAPVMVLNSSELDVVMSRSSPVANRALRRLVRTARERLDRLVSHACEGAVPRTWRERLWDATADALRTAGGRAGLLVFAAWAAAISLAVAGAMRWTSASVPPLEVAAPGLPTMLAVGQSPTEGAANVASPTPLASPARASDPASTSALPLAPAPSPPSLTPTEPAPAPAPALAPVAPIESYAGATVESPDGVPPAWRLEVSGAQTLSFKLLTLDRFDPARGMVSAAVATRVASPPWSCAADCVEVTATLEAGPSGVVVPVPTGYGLDTTSLTAVDRSIGRVLVDSAGSAWLDWPAGASARVRYRVGPRDRRPGRVDFGTETSWPPALEQLIARVRRLPGPERIQPILDAAAARVAYDTSPRAVERLAGASGSWLERVLAHSVGDCDVINGLAVMLLRAVDVPARLAVGIVVEDGVAHAGLHAWVEVETGHGWLAADATGRTPGERAGAAATGDAVPVASVGAGIASPSGAERDAAVEVPALMEDTSMLVRRAGLVAAGLVGLVVVALAAAYWRARVRDRVVTPAQRDEQRRTLARIAKDALQHPEAWRRAETLWNRRMLPTLSGRGLSLSRARARQAQGALFSSRQRGALAAHAAGRNPVLDAADPLFGELIASALRPVDLDAVEAMGVLEAHATEPSDFVRRVRPWLRTTGCTLIETTTLGAAAVLDVDLSELRLPRGMRVPPRCVVINTRHDELRRRVARAESAGLRGLADWIDWLCEHSALVGAHASDVRRRLALALLDEASP